jgi:hypothetical protein
MPPANDPDAQQERDDIIAKLLASLEKLKQALGAFDSRTETNVVIADVKKTALAYADLADARKTTLELELWAQAVPYSN